MSEQKKKSKAGPVAAGAAAIALLLGLWGNGGGFGTGGSNGIGTGSQSEEVQVTETETESQDEQSSEADDKYIYVIIEEDIVTVNGEVCEDAKALKAVVEAINADDKTFELKEENSIKYTHDWVVETFEELDIPLVAATQ